VNVLPDLIHRVEPFTRVVSSVRGIRDTLILEVLVCKSGRVLDAYALPRFRSLNDPQPIEDDPKLVDAAIDAVKQYLFQPATSDGQPVAVWVGVRVSFTH
jgi:hypothetical protein